MHLNAMLDLDVVAVESEDELSVLLELEAPTSDAQAARPPHTLQVVLDRSGSMSGGPLDAAKAALIELVGRLGAQDRFGLVVFDGEVDVVVPSAPLSDRDAVRRLIAGVQPRGSTDLASGLIRGIEEARRTMGETGATVLLLSDGHANHGATDPGILGTFAGAVRAEGITIGAIGIGLRYDETLLSAIAAGGTGNVHFAEEADAVAGALGDEVDGLLEQVVQAASLTVRPGAAVRSVTLSNDLPVSESDGGFVVELGNFMAGEQRKLLLRATIPALQDLGLAEVCRMTLRFTETAMLSTQTVDVPVHVNVVPGDAAAGRIANPTVRTEVVYQQAQRSKKDAADALRRGDRQGAGDLLRGAGDALRSIEGDVPDLMATEMAQEADELMAGAEGALFDPIERSVKSNEAEFHLKSRKRQSMAAREQRADDRRRRNEARRARHEAERRQQQDGSTATDDEPGEGKFG